jgi:ABC-type branched-subunit amino acid transport system ATPase component
MWSAAARSRRPGVPNGRRTIATRVGTFLMTGLLWGTGAAQCPDLQIGRVSSRRPGQPPRPAGFSEICRTFPVLEEISDGRRTAFRQSKADASPSAGHNFAAKMLLLDKPSAGLAEKVSSAVCEMCASAMAVLIAEESCRWLDGVAKRSIVPKTGRVVEIKGRPAWSRRTHRREFI